MNKPLVAPELLLVSQLLPQFQEQPGGLLPLLHAVQDALGFIPANAVPLIAEGMNLSRAEVHGVITYYHFRCAVQKPAGLVAAKNCGRKRKACWVAVRMKPVPMESFPSSRCIAWACVPLHLPCKLTTRCMSA